MDAPSFLPAYATAIYQTKGISFTLTLQANNTVLFSSRPFAIITAHNPKSKALTQEENQARHLELQNLLQNHRYEITPSIGQSPDGSWVEEGFLIFDIPLEQALEIGKHFGQHAILYSQGGRVALAWCEGGLEWFYPEVLSNGL